MCGISGVISLSGAPVEGETIERMRDLVTHRGPDGRGLYLSEDARVGLGHTRLSIQDPTPAGHQPMANHDESIWITFNGEIFNFPELKQRLIQLGYRFRSNCDTEAIIYLYEEYGDDCLQMLNGQFAFVIWDNRKKRVLAARDRVGIRPFYYSLHQEQFVFGSELKSVLSVVGRGAVDEGAISDFLVLQYVPSPNTIYRHIRKLEAGTCIVIEQGDVHVRRYWRPEPRYSSGESEGQLLDRLDDLLSQSVDRQQISDVPLGMFLSGGVDSTTILAYMAQTSGQPVKAYSVGFEEEGYNELPYATLAAERIPNVEHHKVVLRAKDAYGLIQDLIGALDEPFADQAIVPTYLMSRFAKESVTVCLSGEGADEIFGGYDRYHSALQAHDTYKTATRFNPELNDEFSKSLRLGYNDYMQNICSFKMDELPDILVNDSGKGDARGRLKSYYENMSTADELERVQRFDLETYLADNLMYKVDRASMLASLEVRVPFLDPDVVEFGLGLPFESRYRSNMKKYLLKKLAKRYIPEELIFRRKMGFSVPVFQWFGGEFNDYLRDTLTSQKARNRGFIDQSKVEEMLNPQRIASDAHNSLKLWCLLMLEEWFGNYHDNM
jgi:asparagine synthase (glutamine-hydrolysing)